MTPAHERLQQAADKAARRQAERRAQLYLEAAAENAVTVFGSAETAARLVALAQHLAENSSTPAGRHDIAG